MPDNLPELRDIHLPDGVSFWPLGYGWWVILLSLIGVIVLYHLFKFWRLKSQKLYAIRLLKSVDEKNVVNSAAAVSEILRRICVYKYPQASALTGRDWINFLNTHAKSQKLDGKEAELWSEFVSEGSPKRECRVILAFNKNRTDRTVWYALADSVLEVYGLTGRAVAAGNFARLVLLDWDHEVIYKKYKSKAINTPYTGMPLTGAPHAVITGTRVTARS